MHSSPILPLPSLVLALRSGGAGAAGGAGAGVGAGVEDGAGSAAGPVSAPISVPATTMFSTAAATLAAARAAFAVAQPYRATKARVRTSALCKCIVPQKNKSPPYLIPSEGCLC